MSADPKDWPEWLIGAVVVCLFVVAIGLAAYPVLKDARGVYCVPTSGDADDCEALFDTSPDAGLYVLDALGNSDTFIKLTSGQINDYAIVTYRGSGTEDQAGNFALFSGTDGTGIEAEDFFTTPSDAPYADDFAGNPIWNFQGGLMKPGGLELLDSGVTLFVLSQDLYNDDAYILLGPQSGANVSVLHNISETDNLQVYTGVTKALGFSGSKLPIHIADHKVLIGYDALGAPGTCSISSRACYADEDCPDACSSTAQDCTLDADCPGVETCSRSQTCTGKILEYPLDVPGTARAEEVIMDALWHSGSSSNTNTPSGATAYALPVYDETGSLLGYIPVYSSQW